MKKLICLLFVTSTLLTSGSYASEVRNFREISAAPWIGRTSQGNPFILWASMSLPLSSHFQWESGGHVAGGAYTKGSEGLYLGLTYNFSEDWTRSFYLGAGAGMARRYLDIDGGYAYAKIGKRFALNDNRTYYYKPELKYLFDDQGQYKMFLIVHLLQFAWSF